MKPFHTRQNGVSFFTRLTSLFLLGAFSASLVANPIAGPLWWYQEDSKSVINPDLAAQNNALVNVGQAKWMALRSVEELEQVLPQAGHRVRAALFGDPVLNPNPNNIIFNLAAPVTPAQKEAQRAPLQLGQLKAMAKPFYDELYASAPLWLASQRISAGTAGTGTTKYPWNPATPLEANKAVANIGQVKAVFTLDFYTDSDHDGFLDLREEALTADTDGDGTADGIDLYPTDRFNGQAPMLSVAGEWIVKATNASGQAVQGVAIDFYRWPAGAALPQTAIYTSGITTVLGIVNVTASATALGSDRLMAVLKGSPGQRVFLPWKPGSESGTTTPAPGGSGVTLPAIVGGSGSLGGATGQTPNLSGIPGDEGDGEEIKVLSLSDLLSIRNNRIYNDAYNDVEGVKRNEVSYQPIISSDHLGAVTNKVFFKTPSQEEIQLGSNDTPVNSSDSVLSRFSLRDFGAVQVKGSEEEGVETVYTHPSLALKAHLGVADKNIKLNAFLLNQYADGHFQFDSPAVSHAFTLSNDVEQSIGENDFPFNQSLISSMVSNVGNKIEEEGGGWIEQHGRYLIFGPVPLYVPMSVWLGEPFYYRDLSEIRIHAELPFGFPAGANVSDDFGGHVEESKIIWTAEILDGWQYCDIQVSQGDGAFPSGFATTKTIEIKGSTHARVEFKKKAEVEEIPPDADISFKLSASLIPRPGGPATDVGSFTMHLAQSGNPAQSAALASQYQPESLFGTKSSVDGSEFRGGQRSQTLEPERKVGLTGLPAAGASTFVDALTGSFHHQETDFALPIPGSDLILGVSRNSGESIWTKAFGLRPQEDAMRPFGPGWNSNLAAGVVRTAANQTGSNAPPTGSPVSPIEARLAVSDYSGRNFSFLETTNGQFVPDPTLLPDRGNLGISLVRDGTDLVLTQPLLGITHRFQQTTLSFSLPGNRDVPAGSGLTDYLYYRLDSVTDRFGTVLKWDFGGSNTKVVPNRIYVVGRSNLALNFVQGTGDQSGRVLSFWDPSGVLHSFTYGLDSTGSGQQVLTQTSVGGIPMASYGYQFFMEADPRPEAMLLDTGIAGVKYRIPTYHLALKTLADGAGNQTVVTQALSQVRKAYSKQAKQFYTVAGDPLRVSQITLPGGASVIFGGQHLLKPASPAWPAEGSNPAIPAQMPVMQALTQVTDMYGNHWNYNWATPLEMGWTVKETVGDATVRASMPKVSTLFFPSLTLSCTEVANSAVTWTYNGSAGFATTSARDAANRETSAVFQENSGLSHPFYTAPSLGGVELNSRFMGPSSTTNSLGQTTLYRYTSADRQVDSIKDYRGRVLKNVYGQANRNEEVQIWKDESSGGVLTNLLSRTLYGYHATLKGVVTKVTRKAGGFYAAGDPSWVGDLVTTIQIDPAGLGWPYRVGFDANADGDLNDAGDLAIQTTRSLSGRLLQTTLPNGGQRSMLYDSAGRFQSAYLEDGSSFAIGYDKASRPVWSRNALGNAMGCEYDALGRVVKTVVDMNGNLQQNATSLALTGIDSATDLIRSAEYFDVQNEVRSKDERGLIAIIKRDALQRVTDVLAPRGDRSIPANRDPGFLPLWNEDDVTHFDYDLMASPSSPVRVLDALGYETLAKFDPQGRLQKILRQYAKSPGRYQMTVLGYNPVSGLQDSVTAVRTPVDATGAAPGALETLVDRITYDHLDRPATSVSAEGASRPIASRTAYTSTGLPWRSEVRDQLATSTLPERWLAEDTKFDALGRPMTLTLPAVKDATTDQFVQPVSQMIYDSFGQLAAVKDPYGKQTSFGYDICGRTTYVKSPEVQDALSGQSCSSFRYYRYDAVGQLMESTDPTGQTWSLERDPAGRVKRTLGPLLNAAGEPDPVRAIWQNFYDRAGHVQQSIDPESNSVFYTYDAKGRLTSTRTPVTDVSLTGTTTVSDLTESVAYDSLGRVTRTEDGMQHRTDFAYDGLGRLTTRIWDPANGSDLNRARTETFQYDALLPLSHVDAKGQRFNFSYNDRFLSAMVEVVNKPGENQTYQYDDLGRLLSVDTTAVPGMGEPDISRTYDLLGRLQTETSNQVTSTYGYDLRGDLARTTSTANTRVLTYLRDAQSRITAVNDTLGGASKSTQFAYDLAGRLVAETMANGLVQKSDYDVMGRLKSLRLRTAQTKTVLARSDYEYDLRSNVIGIHESTKPLAIPERSITNTYDERSQLVSETQSLIAGTPPGEVESRVEKFRYDKAGNRTDSLRTLTSGGVTSNLKRSFVYGNAGNGKNSNQLAQQTDENGMGTVVHNFTYDPNGNRLTHSRSSATDQYTYDSFDRLVSVGVATGTAAENGLYRYAYDPTSRRIARQNPAGATRRFAFSGSSPTFEWEGAMAPPLAPGLIQNIGGGVGGQLYSYEESAATFPFYNSRGDMVGQSTESGTLTYRASLDSAGNLQNSAGSRIGGYGANSKWEEPVGLINDGFRYRDRNTGSFISRDPTGFADGLNVYSYVSSNPWSSFDPNGLEGAPVTPPGTAANIGYHRSANSSLPAYDVVVRMNPVEIWQISINPNITPDERSYLHGILDRMASVSLEKAIDNSKKHFLEAPEPVPQIIEPEGRMPSGAKEVVVYTLATVGDGILNTGVALIGGEAKGNYDPSPIRKSMGMWAGFRVSAENYRIYQSSVEGIFFSAGSAVAGRNYQWASSPVESPSNSGAPIRRIGPSAGLPFAYTKTGVAPMAPANEFGGVSGGMGAAAKTPLRLPAPRPTFGSSLSDVSKSVFKNGSLPDNFITKAEAKALGWNPKAGNLDAVAPGKSIGGDVFGNKEGLLPSTPGRIWFEADLNYIGGYRGGERLLYSNDGKLFYSGDHYKTFQQIGE